MANVSSRKKPASEFQSPDPDWETLPRAFLFYRSTGFLHLTKDWRLHLKSVVERFADEDGGEHPLPFRVGPVADDRRLSVFACGMVLTISPRTGSFSLVPQEFDEDDEDELLRVDSPAAEFLARCSAYKGPAHLVEGVDWHRRLVEFLFWTQSKVLADAVRLGTAHVMARKNGVLAPFERIMPDQLEYFSAVAGSRPSGAAAGRGPALLSVRLEQTDSAAAPGGEKLYSIHIAPATASPERKPAVRKCDEWLEKLAKDYPRQRPDTRANLFEIACKKFGKIPVQTFKDLYLKHRNASWKTPGRPKNPQKQNPGKK